MKSPSYVGRQRVAANVSMAMPVLAIVAALLIGAVLIAIAGINPWQAYGYMLAGSFGALYGFGETLTRFVPLVFAGLGFSIAYKAGFFNVGGEGQLIVGAIGASIVGVFLRDLPAPVHVPLTMLAGFLAGALWAYVAGLLKITLGSDALINTMMLNYIAVLMIDLLVEGSLKDPNSLMDQTAAISQTARLPYIIPGTRLHLGVVFALLGAYGFYFFLWRTPLGYQLRTVGSNTGAAAYAGMNIVAVMSVAVMLSGGLAGLGGAVELMGSQHRYMHGFSPGYGFDGIGVAVMGRHHPVGIVLASLLFAVIRVGTGAMQRGIGVPLPLLSVIHGLIIIFVVGSSYLTNKMALAVVGGRA